MILSRMNICCGRVSRIFFMMAFLFPCFSNADVPFELKGPGVDPSQFEVTEYATGLNYPVGMVELSDGSVVVGVTNATSFFSGNSGSLVRLIDADADGVAETQQTWVDDVPLGKVSALRSAGDLLFVTGQGSPMAIYRMGETLDSAPSLLGTMEIGYSGPWLHPHSTFATRDTPGVADSYDLFFHLGSQENFADTTATLPFTSSFGPGGNLAGDAIHMVRVVAQGETVATEAPVQIATGLRSAAGMAFHPDTGDLYLQDNGIDGVNDPNEPTSADELNVISAADIGRAIVDFGFPHNYDEYRTGNKIGGEATQPLFAFQPLPAPDGAESEGPNDIAFAPPTFPAGLNNGIFVGMHGKFSLGGTENEENPLVFANLEDGSYFHMIENTEAGVGHLDGLLSTHDSLFIADISPQGAFRASNANTGVIYKVRSLVPEPDGSLLCLPGMLVLLIGRRSRRRRRV